MLEDLGYAALPARSGAEALRLLEEACVDLVITDHAMPQMTGAQFITFCVALAAMLSLFATLYRVELLGKRLDLRIRELRELLVA